MPLCPKKNRSPLRNFVRAFRFSSENEWQLLRRNRSLVKSRPHFSDHDLPKMFRTRHLYNVFNFQVQIEVSMQCCAVLPTALDRGRHQWKQRPYFGDFHTLANCYASQLFDDG